MAQAEQAKPGPFPEATLRVTERFRGDIPEMIKVVSDELCAGPQWEAGHSYLLYETADLRKRVIVAGCGRSGDVLYRDEDIRFWRSYTDGSAPTRIWGRIERDLDRIPQSRQESDVPRPMKDVPVFISGTGRTYELKTNALGEYSVDVEPGQYVIEPRLSGYAQDSLKVAVDSHGCAVGDFVMSVNRSVQGVVRNARGEPVARAYIELQAMDGEGLQQVLLDLSGDDGSYRIDNVYPGSYYLGVNLSQSPQKEFPHPRTYYPGTPDRRLALPVVFTQTAVSFNLDFQVPDPIPTIKVQGQIFENDGSPARVPTRTSVLFREADGPSQIGNKIDAEGRFEYELCEGISYSVSALSFGGPRRESGQVQFTPTKDNHSIVLVLRDVPSK